MHVIASQQSGKVGFDDTMQIVDRHSHLGHHSLGRPVVFGDQDRIIPVKVFANRRRRTPDQFCLGRLQSCHQGAQILFILWQGCAGGTGLGRRVFAIRLFEPVTITVEAIPEVMHPEVEMDQIPLPSGEPLVEITSADEGCPAVGDRSVHVHLSLQKAADLGRVSLGNGVTNDQQPRPRRIGNRVIRWCMHHLCRPVGAQQRPTGHYQSNRHPQSVWFHPRHNPDRMPGRNQSPFQVPQNNFLQSAIAPRFNAPA